MFEHVAPDGGKKYADDEQRPKDVQGQGVVEVKIAIENWPAKMDLNSNQARAYKQCGEAEEYKGMDNAGTHLSQYVLMTEDVP